ncbi:MAG: alanine--tRNA ligase [Pirellulales bacterium]|jgi:alanyl-tRNA synthetase|nr:alanine--tRNA ligase [Pirellulales bacterium]
MKADELREAFLTFFETKGCVRRPSDVLVPRWDPSVLFTPAGMNQFKDHFLGKCKLDFTRATTCQKCLRTGDIDNVGRTARHHTFFEMLGNFSFGDYFKREAIHWAWEFLTSDKWLKIAPERLTISVYEDDSEAYTIWSDEIGIPSTRITRMGEDDNFWPASAPSQGPDGVCGPCSEIFYTMENGSEVEIWNLVFTQFNRVGDPPDNLRPLPSRNIDTGMGLERTCALLQGVDSNFHIDILKPLVEAVAEVCGRPYEAETDDGRRMRRIADHLRACTFAIHENVMPGNNEEKYVVKRLLRRAVLDGHQLGLREPFLYQLPPAVAEIMRSPYPELAETSERVSSVIQREESAFLDTIDGGLARIETLFESIESAGSGLVSGQDAAELYTTHGFPPELLETLAAERNCAFDWQGFQEAMDAHGLRSGAGTRVELFTSGPLDALKKAMHGSEFVGYDATEASGKAVGIIAQDRLCETLDEIDHHEPVIVVLDRTPFYGEAGGQVGDTGWLLGAGDDSLRFEVTDTLREGDFILHRGHLREGQLALGEPLTAKVDTARRSALRRAHSATHLVHAALQHFLGPHAVQQGSKVDTDLLRFDFSHGGSIGSAVLEQIEDMVNANVFAALPVSAQRLPLADARHAGAMMLFGEKYPDIVRMVSMGSDDERVSRELCGGTHVSNTGEIGLVRIVGEESVSAGTRRVTAVTGFESLRRMRRAEQTLSEAASSLKVPTHDLPTRLTALTKELKELRKGKGGAAAAGVSPDELLAAAVTVGDTRLVVASLSSGDAGSMRQCIDQLRRKGSPIAVLLGGCDGGKVTLVAGISRELEERGLSASTWINEAAPLVGGKGGGRKDLAQAGGKDPDKLGDALEAAKAAMQRLLTAS